MSFRKYPRNASCAGEVGEEQINGIDIEPIISELLFEEYLADLLG